MFEINYGRRDRNRIIKLEIMISRALIITQEIACASFLRHDRHADIELAEVFS